MKKEELETLFSTLEFQKPIFKYGIDRIEGPDGYLVDAWYVSNLDEIFGVGNVLKLAKGQLVLVGDICQLGGVGENRSVYHGHNFGPNKNEIIGVAHISQLFEKEKKSPCQVELPRESDLKHLGLERIGDEFFALPNRGRSDFPVVQVLRPSDVSDVGIPTDPNSVYIVREHKLGVRAYRKIIEKSGINDIQYSLLNDEAIYQIRARIRNCIMNEVQGGTLFQDLMGTWDYI